MISNWLLLTNSTRFDGRFIKVENFCSEKKNWVVLQATSCASVSMIPFFFPFHGLKVVTQRNVDDSPFTNTITGRKFSLDPTGWSWYMESVGVSGNNSFTASGLLEQINTTKDTSDFLWYSTRYFLHLLTMCNAWMRQIHYDTWKKKLV